MHPRNDISRITVQRLDEVREQLFLGYHKRWYARKNNLGIGITRFIKTARQIGTTYYFAFEALDDAIRTGNNQIFISTPGGMADVIKDYVIELAREYLGAILQGDNAVILSNNAMMWFLSEDDLLLKGELSGNVYLDQCFYLENFKTTWKLARCFSALKKFRRTLYGTHPLTRCAADAIWNGDEYNKRLDKSKRVVFDLSLPALQNGVLGVDRIWRNAVTVQDAVQDGYDLLDIDDLRAEHTDEEFNNLFMCDFNV